MTLDILKNLISYPTITPQECRIYEYIKSLLPRFKYIEIEKEGVRNIFFYYVPKGVLQEDSDMRSSEDSKKDSKVDFKYMGFKGANSQGEDSQSLKKAFHTLPHFCFAGHIDVVPPGGVVPKNVVLDSKDIESFCVANPMNHSVKRDSKNTWHFHPFAPIIYENHLHGRGTQDMKGGIACFIDAINRFLESHKSKMIISVLLTSDEEGPGIYGTKYMLEELKHRDMLPNYTIVAEPTCEKVTGDTIKIGRRGSINGQILIKGKQGHVAYPEKCVNPVEILGARLGKIAGHNLDEGDDNFSPSKLVITDIRGGMEVVNVTPDSLKIMFNVRNSTKTTLQDVREYIDSALSGLEYELELSQSSKSFLTSKECKIIKVLESCVKKCVKIKPILSTSGGTSDARFFSEYGIEVAELGVCNDRIHAINERVSLRDIESLSEIFLMFLQEFNDVKH